MCPKSYGVLQAVHTSTHVFWCRAYDFYFYFYGSSVSGVKIASFFIVSKAFRLDPRIFLSSLLSVYLFFLSLSVPIFDRHASTLLLRPANWLAFIYYQPTKWYAENLTLSLCWKIPQGRAETFLCREDSCQVLEEGSGAVGLGGKGNMILGKGGRGRSIKMKGHCLVDSVFLFLALRTRAC